MRRACIFCQRRDGKITREHLLPDWLSNFYGPDVMCVNEGVNEDGTVAFRYTSKIFQRTLNEVCSTCNSGWMSDVENDAKPILIRMLKEKNIVLDKKKQQKLATWAYKTVLVINHKNPSPPKEQFIPAEHYSAFYAAQSILPGTIVMLGYKPGTRFENGESIASNWLTLAEHLDVPLDLVEDVKDRMENQGKRIYGATLRIADMVFQILGSNVYDGTTHRVEITIPPEPMRIVNPYTYKIRWPLNHNVDEVGGLEVLHNALKGSNN